MRGSGITLARLLADPADPTAAELGRAAVAAIREALTSHSPLAAISSRLESVLPADAPYNRPPDLEADEQAAWDRGTDPKLAHLATHLCRHAEGVMLQAGASGPARLWQLRSILALDLAVHVARTAWQVTSTPDAERYLAAQLRRQSACPRSCPPALGRVLPPCPHPAELMPPCGPSPAACKNSPKGSDPVDWPQSFCSAEARQSDADEASISSQLRKLARHRRHRGLPAGRARDYRNRRL